MNIDIIYNLIEETKALLKPKNNVIQCKHSFAGNHLLSVLTKLAGELILYKEDTVLCKYQYLLLWRKYTISLESDLPIIVFLANRSIRLNETINKFDWKLVIDHDNEELNSILRQGIADNHYHLGGSLPVFQSIWVELMTNEIYRENIENIVLDKENILKNAALIRQQLIEFSCKRNGKLFEDRTLKGLKKYYEERKILYHIIRELIQEDFKEISHMNLLYSYLVIKEWFRGFVVQRESNIGENSFFSINNNKSLFLKWYTDIGEIVKTGINEQIRSNYIKKLEIRIKLQESSFILYKYLEWLNDQISSFNIEIRYIICFSRKKNIDDNFQYRNQIKTNELHKQVESFKKFLETYPGFARQIIGIDICSREENYKPEVFSEIMIRRKNGIDSRLKRMYHVGEKYSDILSGLRSIDECIYYFELRVGDRLGHAVPVFEKVDQWYKVRKYQITISKEEHLDNLAWLYCNLPLQIQKNETGKKILKEFYCFFCELYQDAFSLNAVLKSFNRRNSKVDIGNVSIFHYYEAWRLRKEKPNTIRKLLLKNISHENKSIVYYIAYCYFYNIEVRNRGGEKVNITITNEMLTLIQIMQNHVKDKIRIKGICLEVCPSSNIFLGNVDMGYCHPIINLFNKNVLKENDICVSINTDDQSIFGTSLMQEYSLLVNAYENESDINGDAKYNKEFLYKWINIIRKNSLRICESDYEKK